MSETFLLWLIVRKMDRRAAFWRRWPEKLNKGHRYLENPRNRPASDLLPATLQRMQTYQNWVYFAADSTQILSETHSNYNHQLTPHGLISLIKNKIKPGSSPSKPQSPPTDNQIQLLISQINTYNTTIQFVSTKSTNKQHIIQKLNKNFR